ncbi:MAG TPA: hypothetical protein VF857_03110 [Spirochaetota bacterium]
MLIKKRTRIRELEDSPSCPALIRNFVTDTLCFGFETANPYGPVFHLLGNLIIRTNSEKIIDLCSGAGGPWKNLNRYLQSRNIAVDVTFTDLFPSKNLFRKGLECGDNFSVLNGSVDATNHPENITGLKTLFTSFHHFTEDKAKKILTNAVRKNEPIAIFEVPHRSVKGLCVVSLAALSVFVLTPFIRPFSIKRLVLTYLVPIIPFVIFFDGIVSYLNAYTLHELKTLSQEISASHYTWSAGETRGGINPVPVTWLIGEPARR